MCVAGGISFAVMAPLVMLPTAAVALVLVITVRVRCLRTRAVVDESGIARRDLRHIHTIPWSDVALLDVRSPGTWIPFPSATVAEYNAIAAIDHDGSVH